MTDRADAIAAEIKRSHEAGERYRNLEGALEPASLEEAYAAQYRLHQLHVHNGRGPLGGRKIALASKVLQELCGVNAPIAGGIFAREIWPSGAEIRVADFNGPGLEFELAAKLGADITPGEGPFDRESIRTKVESVHPAFEIIIDRGADYSNLRALTMAADNAWCGGVVLGPPIPGWRDMNIDALPAVMRWNDEPPVEAKAGDSDPFGSLAWVANVLTGAGQSLKAGEIVITGSVIKTRAPKPGDRVRHQIGAWEVELRAI